MPYGSARPRAKLGKSWSSTSRSSHRQARPPFLKLPTNSFFFVSTLIIGQPCRWNRRRRRPNRRNCRSRNGSCFPPSRLRLERNEYFSPRNRRATVTWLACTPCRRKATANLRVVLCVHRRPPIGLPAVASRNNSLSSLPTRGVFFPHPFVRHRDDARDPTTRLVHVRSPASLAESSCGSVR